MSLYGKTVHSENECAPNARGRRRRVAMVVYSYYPADARIKRAAEALAGGGMDVEVMCLRAEGDMPRDQINGVRVVRFNMRRKRAGKIQYVVNYAMFTLMAFLRLSIMHPIRRYSIIHVHNMPDLLVLSALVPRLTGAKVMLDLHDPMPEVYQAKYGLANGHWLVRLLARCERFAIAFSHQVITTNIAFADLFISRGCPKEKIAVVMNSPDEKDFGGAQEETAYADTRDDQEFVIMYHGTIVERHGLDLALEAIATLQAEAPGLRFEVYGTGDAVEVFQKTVKRLGIESMVRYHGYVDAGAIAAAIQRADLGLIPNRRNVFTNLNMPMRIFEYLSLGKPVIAPRTRGIKDYFAEDEIAFFEPGDSQDLARIIRGFIEQPEKATATLARSLAVYQQHRWPAEADRLRELVDGLLAPQPSKDHRASTPIDESAEGVLDHPNTGPKEA